MENGFLLISTPKYKKFNKTWIVDNDGGLGAADGDGGDAQASLDPSRGEDQCPSASSPSKSLPEVGYLRFLVSTSVRSILGLNGVKLFEEANEVEGRTTTPYGRAPPVPVVVELSDCFVLTFSQQAPPIC
jgi:hypothetical protein